MVFHKYKKIYIIGHEENKDIFSCPEDKIVIEEKIDGSNFRFTVINGNLVFGSHTQELTENTSNIKFFESGIKFVKDKINGKDLSIYEGFIFYGEFCVKHTINYDWDLISRFLGFDILKNDVFINYDEAKKIFNDLDLEFVPVINVCKASEITEINDDLVPISKYALSSSEDRKAEGVVFKNYGKQIFAKYVRDKFKEKNSECFGGNPKYNKVDDTNNSDFVFMYCTNARIEKLIFKQLHDGKTLGMELMGCLIKDVYVDIVEENWREILLSNWKLDFRNIRKIVAVRVKSVLSQVIVNNSLK